MVDSLQREEEANLHLPRILCLHGGGTNAVVFRIQCRALISYLKHSFRLVFVDAPFSCEPHPAIIPIYEEYGPFLRWLRWLSKHPPVQSAAIISQIDANVQRAMKDDDRRGGTGDWVALMGFSQGAKIAASLLYRQQVRGAKLGKDNAGSNYKFAVLMAGRAPLVSFDPKVITSPAIIDASRSAEDFAGWPDDTEFEDDDHMLTLPTIHVHGLKDPGLAFHRRLMTQYCLPSSVKVMEWNGDHRIPLLRHDAMPLVEMILRTAEETGALKA